MNNLAEVYERNKEDFVTDFCPEVLWVNSNSLPWCRVFNGQCDPKYKSHCPVYREYLNKRYMEE